MATLHRRDNSRPPASRTSRSPQGRLGSLIAPVAMLVLFLASSLLALTARADDWQAVSEPTIQIEEGWGLYDRRTRTFRATVTVTNRGAEPLSGEYRLVLDSANKTPSGPVTFDDGCAPCFPIAALSGLQSGQSVEYVINFQRGRGRLAYSVHLEHLPSLSDPPTVMFAEPADGVYVGASPATVSGSASGDGISLTINGDPVPLNDGSFSAQIPLTEGPNTLTAQVTDSADRQASAQRTLHLDTTAPTISAQASPTANAAGWHNTGVTVTFLCSDDGSGIANCPEPVRLSDDGAAQRVSGNATDNAGNSADTSVDLSIDTLPPQLNIETPTDGSLLGYSPVQFTGSASDATSGLTGITCNDEAGTLGADTFNCEVAIVAGANTVPVSLVDNAGNSTDTQINITYDDPPEVVITDPSSLITVGATPLTVTGTVDDPDANLTVNGASVDGASGSFSVDVNLEEGLNTVVARAVDANGLESTDSIAVSLDATEPYVTIDYPEAEQVLYTDAVDVSGLVNDIVRGTVADEDANVTVNGVQAEISNRSYIARDVPLNPGGNTLLVQASDAVGNVGETSVQVTYDPNRGRMIELVSGQDQVAEIFATLTDPLTVKLVEADGVTPVVGENVVFRVVQGDGLLGLFPLDDPSKRALAVTSNDEGIASARFAVGSHAGVGNNRVRAAAVGFDGEVLFHAAATPRLGDKISIIAGNNQRGAVRQPLPHPLVVAVTDNGSNLIEGARVRFDIAAGGGTFFDESTRYETTTDNDGRASAQVILGGEDGLDVQRFTATLLDTSSTEAVLAGFTASALIPAEAGDTSISGVVLDNQDNPVPGVALRVEAADGEPANREAVSDAQGQFEITDVPVGPIHLLADGSTANTETTEWPTLSYNLVTIAGADNPLHAPIYLVPLNIEEAQTVGAEDVVYTLPEVPGFSLTVQAGSVTFPDGAKQGDLSVTVVNANKIPMPPPNGMQPQFIVTIQPHGAIFDPPAPLTLPNVDGHSPGALVEMYSYDHDLEEFVTIGLGTVSEDGSIIASNNGVGVIKAGWHCGSLPGGSGCSHNCGECQSCDASCTCYWDNGKSPTSITDTPNDCKKPACQNGPKQVADTSDLPSDTQGDCKKPVCDGGTPKQENDDSDKPTNDTPHDCKKPGCKNGVPSNEPDTSDTPVDECKECKPDGTVANKANGTLPGSTDKCCFDGETVNKTGLDIDTLLAKCPARTQNSRQHDIDGCSGGVSQDPAASTHAQAPTAFGIPQGVISSAGAALNLPCNQHDICYQTCGSTQSNCDQQMRNRMDAVCDAAFPSTCPYSGWQMASCPAYFGARAYCYSASGTYHTGLSIGGGSAWRQRQTQYCDCCP